MPIRSKPALQNADMLWKTENQMPVPAPNSGIKRIINKSAPASSTEKVKMRMRLISFITPA